MSAAIRLVGLLSLTLAAGIVAALLTAAAGAGFLMRRRWGLWLALIAVTVTPLFPPATRLLLPERLQFHGPDLGEWLVASSIGLVASAAFMFRRGFAANA